MHNNQMILPVEYILVKEITSSISVSEFNTEDIEVLARSILKVGGLIRPIIVRPTSVTSYEVIEGHREYHAAVRAEVIDPQKGDIINVVVIEGKKAKAIEEQAVIYKLLDS